MVLSFSYFEMREAAFLIIRFLCLFRVKFEETRLEL